MTGTAEARFWIKVDRLGADDCWEWLASRVETGYGMFHLSRYRSIRAHRFAYQSMVGPIPEGLELDHLCRNRACVNPAHLEPVSHRENTLRGQTVTGENARKTHCIRGHLLPAKRGQDGHRRCLACERVAARGQRNRIGAAGSQTQRNTP